MSGYGFHYGPCPGPSGGGGKGGVSAGAVALLFVIVVAVAERRAVEHGLEVLLEVVIVVIGVLAAAGVTAAVLVIRSRRRRRLRAERQVLTAVPVRPGLPGHDAPALPRSNTPTYSRIHADPHVVTGRVTRPAHRRRADRRQ